MKKFRKLLIKLIAFGLMVLVVGGPIVEPLVSWAG
jgi:hypothetical protein